MRARTFVCSIVIAMTVAAVAHLGASTDYVISLNSWNDSWLTTTTQCQFGFGAIEATATSVGNCEKFTLIDLNGGSLVDGDEVAVRSHNSSDVAEYYWSASNDELNATEECACEGFDAVFVVYDMDCVTSGCSIAGGDKLVFQSTTTGKYVRAINGGGGDVDTGGTSVSYNYSRFEVIFH